MKDQISFLQNASKVLRAIFDYYKNGFFIVDFESIINGDEPYKIDINDDKKVDKILSKVKNDYEVLPPELSSKKNIFIETILYIYGLWVFKNITKQEFRYTLNVEAVKFPGIFQLLSSILKENYAQRESDYYMLKTYIDIALDESKEEFFKYYSTDKYLLEGFSSVGLIRDEDQDSFDWFYDDSTKSLLLVVADGMGGGDFGKRASKIAVNIFKQEFDNLCKLDENEIDDYLKHIIMKINETILQIIKNENLRSMGTTVSAVFIKNDKVFFGHVGDSRIYIKYKNEETFKPITQDHSWVEVEFRKGNISEEEKKKYKKNILAYVVGSDKLTEDVINTTQDYGDINFNEVDCIVICCDGVWDLIDKKDFNNDIKTIYRKLNNKITHDNATLIKLTHNQQGNNFSKPLGDKNNREIKTIVKKERKIGKNRKILQLFSILIVIILIGLSVYATKHDIVSKNDLNKAFNKSYLDQNNFDKTSGNDNSYIINSITQTSDGGYILRLLDKNGSKEWNKIFGESKWNHANLAGYTIDKKTTSENVDKENIVKAKHNKNDSTNNENSKTMRTKKHKEEYHEMPKWP